MAEQVAAVGVEKQVEVRVMGDALEDAVRGEPLDGRAERIAGLTEKPPSSRLRKRIRPSRSHPCRILIASTLFTETLLPPYRQLYPCGLNINHLPQEYHSTRPNPNFPPWNAKGHPPRDAICAKWV